MDLKTRTIKGVKWSGVGQITANGIDFVVYAVLARILFPEDFGIFAMATVFTGFIATINQLGLEIAIIQRKDIEEAHLSTCFWIILIFGIVLSLSVICAAPLLAEYFFNKLVQPILMVLSLNFVITAVGFVHYALLQRWIQFHKIALIEIITILTGGSVSIVMAVNGWGVWSLVWGWISQSVIRTTISWIVCHWRPKMIVDFQRFRELFSFGKSVVGCRISQHLSSNIMYLLIGRAFDKSVLGIYFLAYKLSHIPPTKLSPIISKVALPTFSAIQDDSYAIGWIYQKKIKYISLVAFPLLFGVLVTAPRFIEVIYGYKWTASIVPLQILCFMGIVKSVTGPAGAILRSKGRPDIDFRWNVLTGIVYPIVLLASLKYNLIGVCISLTLVTFILYGIFQYAANSLIYLNLKDYLASLYPAIISSLLMMVGILAYEKFGGAMFDKSNPVGLLVPVALGAIIYLGAIRLLFSSLHREIIGVLLHKPQNA